MQTITLSYFLATSSLAYSSSSHGTKYSGSAIALWTDCPQNINPNWRTLSFWSHQRLCLSHNHIIVANRQELPVTQSTAWQLTFNQNKQIDTLLRSKQRHFFLFFNNFCLIPCFAWDINCTADNCVAPIKVLELYYMNNSLWYEEVDIVIDLTLLGWGCATVTSMTEVLQIHFRSSLKILTFLFRSTTMWLKGEWKDQHI